MRNYYAGKWRQTSRYQSVEASQRLTKRWGQVTANRVTLGDKGKRVIMIGENGCGQVERNHLYPLPFLETKHSMLMAQVIQMSLPFETTETRQERKDGRKVIWEYMGITLLEPTKKAGKDPCKNCWAKGLCDDGECGRKLFPIDVNEIY